MIVEYRHTNRRGLARIEQRIEKVEDRIWPYHLADRRTQSLRRPSRGLWWLADVLSPRRRLARLEQRIEELEARAWPWRREAQAWSWLDAGELEGGER